jgi:hypothetical protein
MKVIYVVFKFCTSEIILNFSKFSTTNDRNQSTSSAETIFYKRVFYAFHYCNDVERAPIATSYATVLMAKALSRNNTVCFFQFNLLPTCRPQNLFPSTSSNNFFVITYS